jgi:hypothetical protein
VVNTPQDFVHRLAEIQMPLVFNPYKDVCPIHDLPDAPIIRQRNLVQWLEAAQAQRVESGPLSGGASCPASPLVESRMLAGVASSHESQ